jgi:N-glycosylase/DNA lyase
MTLPVPAGFNLWSTIHSHGWSALRPFHADRGARSLRLVVRLSPSKLVSAVVTQPGGRDLLVRPSRRLTPAESRALASALRTCLRLDEDFSEFYARAAKHPEYRWIHAYGAGRMLRSPSVFEDVVKMICTTNCSWALTEIMTANLCAFLGDAVGDGEERAFPTPAAVAASSDAFLRTKVRAGYRSPYLLELARRIDRGALDCESWRASALPTTELLEEIRGVKGIGPYAAGNILKLLGRYDSLGIDSWCRKKYADAFHRGRRVADATIERRYPKGDPWRGLFFWMDMTKDWYPHGA